MRRPSVTIAVCPSAFIVSTKPSAVIGLTNIEAPSAALASSGRTMTSRALILRYCAYIPPPTIPTRLPSRPATSEPAAHHCPRAFVADRHRLVEARLHAAHRPRRDRGRERRQLRGAPRLERLHVGRTEKQCEVGRVERRRLDLDNDLVGTGRIDRGVEQFQPELAVAGYSRAQFEPGQRFVHARFHCDRLIGAS